jgi:hypothetical protein
MTSPRLCAWCNKPLHPNSHGSRKFHPGVCRIKADLERHRVHATRWYYEHKFNKVRVPRDQSKMMKLLRDDYVSLKLSGQIKIPNRGK